MARKTNVHDLVFTEHKLKETLSKIIVFLVNPSLEAHILSQRFKFPFKLCLMWLFRLLHTRTFFSLASLTFSINDDFELSEKIGLYQDACVDVVVASLNSN